MGWSSGFRAIDDLPRAHWDGTEFRWLSFLGLQINKTTNISTIFFQINTMIFIWAKTIARLHTIEEK